jgi:hypothetical protein
MRSFINSIPYASDVKIAWSRDISARTVMGYRTTKESGYNSQKGQESFFFCTVSRLALGSTQLPLQWVPGPLSLDKIFKVKKLTTDLHPLPRLKTAEL